MPCGPSRHNAPFVTRSFRLRGAPFCQHRRQSGAGVGCRHRSSFCRPGAGPCSARILRGRLCACRRAYRGGAVRAPDCAREAEGAPLPSASHGFSESGAARPRNARGRGSGCRFPGDHHSTLRQMSSPKHEQRSNFPDFFHASRGREGIRGDGRGAETGAPGCRGYTSRLRRPFPRPAAAMARSRSRTRSPACSSPRERRIMFSPMPTAARPSAPIR